MILKTFLIAPLAQIETELKFMVPRSRLGALAADMRQGKVRIQRLLAIYYDTVDDRLAASNVSVRLRKEGRRWVQTAKASTPDSVQRLEHNVVLKVPRQGDVPVIDVGLHDGTPPGLAIRNALGIVDARSVNVSLVERFRTDVSRLTRVEQFEGARLELALDTGKIVAGNRSLAISEFEMELKLGPVQSLFRLAAQWAGPHGLWLSSVSKARRGVRLATGDRVNAVDAEVLKVDTHAGQEHFFVAVVESCLRQILGNASEIGTGAADEELVHQLRVGLRRLRTALRELGSVVEGLDPDWEVAFRTAFQALGANRDEVTVLPALRKEMAQAGLEWPFTVSAVSVAPGPEAVVQSIEFQRALLGVMSFCHNTSTVSGSSGSRQRLKKRVGSRLARLHEEVERDAKHFSRLSSSRQHRVRKRLKRLRYLAEFSAPLFDNRHVRRYLNHWREAQDALGDQNDQRVGFDWLLDASSGMASKRMKRWSSSRLRASVKRCDSALRKALKVQVYWKD